jgi:hypothetical protein
LVCFCRHLQVASPPPQTCKIGALQQTCEEELKRCYCIRKDPTTPGRYLLTQNTDCCPKPGPYAWACASKATGNVTQGSCSSYSAPGLGSDAHMLCSGVTNVVIQQRPGASGLVFYMQDQQIKGNDNSSAARCGSPSGNCGNGGVSLIQMWLPLLNAGTYGTHQARTAQHS